MVYDMDSERFKKATGDLAEIAAFFYSQGWMYATSGNLSAVLNNDPLELAISASGVPKGSLNPSKFIVVDSDGKVISGNLKPSAETLLHIEVVHRIQAKFISHTHSKWATVLSQKYGPEGGFYIKDLEMLKALDSVVTHQHDEWIPVLDNSQDMKELSRTVGKLLDSRTNIHCFLLKGHGMYTWGNSIEQAKINVEALEFLMEVHGMASLLQKV